MNISENDKRWIAVLVASNKIVTPLLRDFVSKGIGKLYDFLNDHLQNISTPCSLETLTDAICHSDPFFRGMTFKNINNNKEKSKKDYNYSINSPVELAKLYLPAILAKFAGFDHSMDLSAALNLLGYDDYPTQVFVSSNPSLDIKSLANDFRKEVRNPQAHYDEERWTEYFTNQRFEKLEALVHALVLPADEEENALYKVHEWKTNGWDLITVNDVHYRIETFKRYNDIELQLFLSKLEKILEQCKSNKQRISSVEKCLHLSEKDSLEKELVFVVYEVSKKLKATDDNQISGAHGQLVSTLSPSSGTSVVSEDDLSGEASHMNEESGDKTYEGSTSNIVSENSIDSSGEDLPENQPHVERINPDIVLLKFQIGLSFKIEFTGKLPEGMESGVADFHNLSMGVNLVKLDDKTLWGEALPHSSTEGVFKVAVFSQNRERYLGETEVVYIDLIEEVLQKAISCPNMMLKFLQVAIPCLNVHSEGGTRDAENHTNGGPYGSETSLLSVQLLQRFIYVAAKVNAVWFIRLIFDLPAGRIVFDSYKGRPLLPEYVARARGHNEIAEYLEDVTKRYSGSERTDEEKCNVINWQEIVTAIEATQESPNSFSEIMKTGENTAPSQKVREKERRSNFSDKQLNYFKFAQIVTTEFPRALRQTFRTMWDNKFGNMTGFKSWDDSPDVRYLFLEAEGGKTRVPTHLSYEEWDFFALIQAIIHARSFAKPDSKGQRRKLPHGKFNASVMSPVGYDLESSLHAIHQLRLLRNLFCHSLKAEIDKETFDHYVQQTKEAFIALGIATDKIDAIALKESDSSPPVPWEVEDGIRQEVLTDVKYLEGFRGNKSEEIVTMLKQKIEDLQQEHRQTIKFVGRKKSIFTDLLHRLMVAL